MACRRLTCPKTKETTDEPNLLSLYGLKWNPFAPDVPVEALHHWQTHIDSALVRPVADTGEVISASTFISSRIVERRGDEIMTGLDVRADGYVERAVGTSADGDAKSPLFAGFAVSIALGDCRRSVAQNTCVDMNSCVSLDSWVGG